MIRTAALSLATLAATLAAVAPANAAERRFDLSGFDRVALAGSDDVVVRHGSGFAVLATGETADLDKLEILVDKGVLKIGRKRGNWSWGGKTVTVAVTMPALHGIAVAGSGNLKADRGEGETFGLRVAGSGDADVAAIDARTVNVDLSGSGDVAGGGRCGALNIRIAGSGDVAFGNLKCTNTAISIAGSGDVAAHATGQADIRIAGSGDVTITGGAKCIKKVAGSGDVRCS
ncbi:MAG: head GIN domain-containing protein [Sphingomonadales bacterium]|jgi:hypothetical protein